MVQANCDSPLLPHDNTTQLLMLERMRQIDVAHAWAPSTLSTISRDLHRLDRFTFRFGTSSARVPLPTSPPHGPSIRLAWFLEWYTTQPSKKSGFDFISFAGARSVRSALSALTSWSYALLPSGHAIRTPTKALLRLDPPGVAASDNVQMYLVTEGMSRRLGTESRPPLAVRQEHVRFNLQYRASRFPLVLSPADQLQLALANLCELFLPPLCFFAFSTVPNPIALSRPTFSWRLPLVLVSLWASGSPPLSISRASPHCLRPSSSPTVAPLGRATASVRTTSTLCSTSNG